MTQLLDSSFSYLCRATHLNEEGKSPIVLRIGFRGQRRDIFTGLYCFKKDWDKINLMVSQKDKRANLINKNLSLLLRKANQCFDELRFSGDIFTIDELVDKIKGKESRPTLLIEFLEEGNKKMRKRIGTEISEVTYEKYERSIAYMKQFLQKEYKASNFGLHKVNKDFLEKYFLFLRSDKKASHNHACKYLSFVKTIFIPAIKAGILKQDPFYELRIRKKPMYPEFLSSEELDKLIKASFKDPDLDRKRDIFLFACYTGLAYIDLQQLRGGHLIADNDGSWYIRKPRQKTGQESIIPLLPPAIRILEKYSLTNSIADFNWYISSNQKMNEGLKHVGKKAGITKKLHMHLARHTFATTVTLGNGVPIETVSKMLGHSNIQQTQHYAKVIPSKIKLDMVNVMSIYK